MLTVDTTDKRFNITKMRQIYIEFKHAKEHIIGKFADSHRQVQLVCLAPTQLSFERNTEISLTLRKMDIW